MTGPSEQTSTGDSRKDDSGDEDDMVGKCATSGETTSTRHVAAMESSGSSREA